MDGDRRGVAKIGSWLGNNATQTPIFFFKKKKKKLVYFFDFFLILLFFNLKITRDRGIMGIFRQKEYFSKVLIV
jgi:hypothetical protein